MQLRLDLRDASGILQSILVRHRNGPPGSRSSPISIRRLSDPDRVEPWENVIEQVRADQQYRQERNGEIREQNIAIEAIHLQELEALHLEEVKNEVNYLRDLEEDAVEPRADGRIKTLFMRLRKMTALIRRSPRYTRCMDRYTAHIDTHISDDLHRLAFHGIHDQHTITLDYKSHDESNSKHQILSSRTAQSEP